MEKFRTELIEKFKKEFPTIRVKDGRNFDGGSAVLWSGEDNYLQDGMPAFNYYADNEIYEFGVHRDLISWAERNGLEWEAYDAGTFLAYFE